MQDRLWSDYFCAGNHFSDAGRCGSPDRNWLRLPADCTPRRRRAYEKLSSFATKNASTVWGARAALALGYEDYTKNHLPQALNWFAKAKKDALLSEYVLYWSAQAKRGQKNMAGAFADLQTFQQEYPNSAMREQFLEAYAPTARDTGHAQDAIEALNAYPPTNTRPVLLLERAQAYKIAHQLPRAAKDYQTLYYKYPLSDEAKAAATALPQIARELGREYSSPTLEMQEQRAQIFFDAHKWKEARAEFEKVVSMVRDPASPKRQRAQLRIAQVRIQLKGSPTLLSSLTTPDPEIDAERLFGLSQAYRTAKNESEMFATLDSITQKYPQERLERRSLDGLRQLLLGSARSPEGCRRTTSDWSMHFPMANTPTTPNGALRGLLF